MASSSLLSQTNIRRFFVSLPDPRRRRKRIKHPLLTLVVIALCATIAGADNWEEVVAFAHARRDWLKRRVPLPGGIPSHDTFARVFAALDPVAFQKCLLAWVQRLHEVTKGQVIAIDGKVAREAMARAGEQGPLTLVSAWATANHVFLGQVAGPKGSNELAALPKLLELLDLQGAIVTIDALGCQKEIVKQIVDQGGDYVISVKGNQEKLQQAVHEAFRVAFEEAEQAEKAGASSPSSPITPATGTTRTTRETRTMRETSHGRCEERRVTVLPVPADFPQREEWTGLKSIVMVARDCQVRGKEQSGVRYFISSLAATPANIKRMAKIVRSHWSVENELHWVLDVAFGEDRNRARADNEPANLGVMRRTAVSLLRNTEGLKGSIHCRRQQAAWDEKTLELVLFGQETAEG